MTNNLELKEKAFQYAKERRWDYLLVLAFLELKDYPSWSKQYDFNERLNIGLENISSEQKLLVCGYLKQETMFVKATYKNIRFSIGAFTHFYDDPEGDSFNILASSLMIDEKTALTIKYRERNFDTHHFPGHYKIMGVEELHVDLKIDELLLGIEALINEHKEEKEKRRKKQENHQYNGKFSLAEETESKTAIKPAETQTQQQSSNDSTSYQLGKMFGKLFK